MVAGIVDHETGERDVTRLGGLFGLLPVTGCAAAVAAFSNAGLPPMLGFVAKEYFYKAKLDLADFSLILTGAALLANAFLVVVALLVGYRPFYGTRLPTPKRAHEASWPMLVGPVTLALLGLFFGALPSDFDTAILEPAVRAVMGDPTISIKLALWHNLIRSPTAALALSVVTIIAGATIYRRVGQIRALPLPVTPSMEHVYQGALAGLLAAAGALTRLLQNGYLRYYLVTVVVVSVALVLSYMIGAGVRVPMAHVAPPAVHEGVVCVLIMLGALFAVRAPSLLSAIVSLGVVGLGMSMIFFLYSAPDLAETQIFVETLAVILFVLAFYRLPKLADYSSTTTKVRDAGIAVLVGIMMTWLVLVAGHAQPETTVARYFADNSYTLAMGRNVVNVILVDFRALDTLGEIAVLGVAALGIFAIRKLPARAVEGRS
jgi:multicomponent Na+:H+ antiporter subunit A